MGFESILKNVFVMVLVSIRTRTKCSFENSLKRCLWNVFLKVILKRCLCNGSRFYKNVYKEFCLLKFFSIWKCWCKNVFFVVSKRATRRNLPTQRSLVLFSSSFRCCYLTICLIRNPVIGCEGTGVGHRIVTIAMLWDILAFLFKELRSFARKNS